jgi:hypothetical protein
MRRFLQAQKKKKQLSLAMNYTLYQHLPSPVQDQSSMIFWTSSRVHFSRQLLKRAVACPILRPLPLVVSL